MEIRKVETEYKGKLFHGKDSGTACLRQVLIAVSAVSIYGFSHSGLENLSEQVGLIL